MNIFREIDKTSSSVEVDVEEEYLLLLLLVLVPLIGSLLNKWFETTWENEKSGIVFASPLFMEYVFQIEWADYVEHDD